MAEFTDRKNFKSYDELKKKLNEVLSGDSFASKSAAQMIEEDDVPVRSAPTQKSMESSKVASKSSPMDEDDDDVMSYFEKIANDD